MIADTLSSGHPLLADWLLLLAGIVFAIHFVLGFIDFDEHNGDGPAMHHRAHAVRFVSLGLALLAFGLFVI